MTSEKDLLDQIRKDIEFLLTFAPARRASEVEPGLSPFMYVTGSYEKDVQLIGQIEEICDRYGIEDFVEEEDFEESD